MWHCGKELRKESGYHRKGQVKGQERGDERSASRKMEKLNLEARRLGLFQGPSQIPQPGS